MKRTARIAVIFLAGLGLVGQARAQVLVPVPLAPGSSVARLEPPSELTPPSAALPPPFLAEQAAEDGRERFWSNGDYLLGWFRSQSLPALVTTSSPGTPLKDAGVIGNPNTRVLFGDTGVNGGLRSGMNFGIGAWLDGPKTIGIDVGFMILESQATLFSTNSQVNPILARPFVSIFTGQQTSQIVAFPGTATGSVTASDRSNNLYGAHMDFQEIFLADTNYRLESIFGYQFLNFNDHLQIDQNVKSLGGGGVPPGTQFVTDDTFSAGNQFHGLDLGMRAEFFFQRWFFGLLGKVALGDVHRVVAISGNTQITVPGQTPVTSNAGVLALSSNIGTYHQDQFTAVPEFGATCGWNVTNWFRVHVGYSILFLNDMARAGDQVSLLINPNLFPTGHSPSGTPVPAYQLMKSDLWIQSVNLGMEFRY